ncbi:MAG: hypothetical protein HYV15_07335 [Elusimicrobia bacterium]|nr:hypothetical protein [Elusimicrobiota bacterium]
MRLRAGDQLPEAIRLKATREIFAPILKADYHAALKKAALWRKRHPGDFYLAARYASVLGDFAEECPPAARRRHRAESIRLMRDLLRRTACRPSPRVLGMLKNEYYWQTKQRRKQYRLGVDEARRGYKGGHYSQGVGAAWHALELAQRGRRTDAGRWAARAVTAWKRFAKANPSYYNQFVHRALAEGVRGDIEAMESCLRLGARLARKPLDYREFEEVREAVRKLAARRRPRGGAFPMDRGA